MTPKELADAARADCDTARGQSSADEQAASVAYTRYVADVMARQDGMTEDERADAWRRIDESAAEMREGDRVAAEGGDPRYQEALSLVDQGDTAALNGQQAEADGYYAQAKGQFDAAAQAYLGADGHYNRALYLVNEG
jgi:hypothetical protein